MTSLKQFFLTRSHASRKKITERIPHAVDKWLLLVALVISVFGIVMVYDSSVAIAIRDFGDPYYYVREQLRWLAIGYVSLGVFSFIDYHRWKRLALPMLIVTLGLLLAVFIPGFGVRALGAHRWLNFRFFIMQPAELAKLVLIVYFSAWFSFAERSRLFAFLLLIGMVFGLVVIEPDLGTSVVILGIALILYFFSGAPIRHFLVLFPLAAVGIMALAIVSPYRFQRMTTFFNPERDPLGASYQIRQVLLGLGSGGITGVGLGKSRQKYQYLPEANTDSIFAVVGEEVGLIGASGLMGLFLFLIWRGFRIAKRAPDMFGRLLAGGIAAWIGIQTSLNLAAMVALVPLTGIPLPLVSYGGSSLVILLTGIGILLNVSRAR